MNLSFLQNCKLKHKGIRKWCITQFGSDNKRYKKNLGANEIALWVKRPGMQSDVMNSIIRTRLLGSWNCLPHIALITQALSSQRYSYTQIHHVYLVKRGGYPITSFPVSVEYILHPLETRMTYHFVGPGRVSIDDLSFKKTVLTSGQCKLLCLWSRILSIKVMELRMYKPHLKITWGREGRSPLKMDGTIPGM